ncbi:MAG TPA: alpha-L-fucosidase, partial [Terracidiphilus sp.]|nr:alpha-L-fucosidase [Terracidiphilus sp.]
YQRQVDALASNYGKVDILWFDGGGDEWLGFGGVEFRNGTWQGRPKSEPYQGGFDWHDSEIVQHLRALQPDIVINDRTDAPADFRSREGDHALGTFENEYPWELCTTITEGAWGYQPNAKVKPFAQLIHLLIGAAGRDGNFLLNVSPTPDGEIPAAQADRVREIGRWLRENGDSIYGTRGGPWLPGSYGVSTHNGNTVYIHVLQAPKDSTLSLPALPIRVRSASLLRGAVLHFEQSGRSLTIRIPADAYDPVDTILKLELDRPWDTSAVVPVPAP